MPPKGFAYLSKRLQNCLRRSWLLGTVLSAATISIAIIPGVVSTVDGDGSHVRNSALGFLDHFAGRRVRSLVLFQVLWYREHFILAQEARSSRLAIRPEVMISSIASANEQREQIPFLGTYCGV
jgi:hypothetical protein